MSTQKPASWTYAEEFVPEGDIVESARRNGEGFGATPIGPAAGATLRLLAAAIQAKAVVEVGTGAGVSGLWLLQGMHPEGVLTTIDPEPEHQRAAKLAYAKAGVAHQRTRVIGGRALDVLPRLTDAAYDIVVIDADKAEYPAYVEEAIRLLRPGGILVLDNMLWHDKVADPAARDEVTTTLRDLGKQLRDRDDLMSVLLACSDGLFVALKR